MLRFLFIIFFFLASATSGMEIASDAPSEARKLLDATIVPEFRVENSDLWGTLSALRKTLRTFDGEARFPEFILNEGDVKIEKRLTLHLTHTSAAAILDTIATEAGCVWFCNRDSVIVIPCAKVVADYAPREISRSELQACQIALEGADPIPSGVRLKWMLTVSGLSREAFLPNLAFQIAPRDAEGNTPEGKLKSKALPLQSAPGFGKYRYDILLEGIQPEVVSLDVKVTYSGKTIYEGKLPIPSGPEAVRSAGDGPQ